MDKEWNTRLRDARLKRNLSLKEVGENIPSALTQQSLIKYEKGDIFPKIDILEELCNLYQVTINYIMYGNESSIHFNIAEENILVTLLFLMHKNSITFQKELKILSINDDSLRSKIYKLSVFLSKKDFTTIEDLQILINGIKKISKE